MEVMVWCVADMHT